jgi:hypothetical protein
LNVRPALVPSLKRNSAKIFRMSASLYRSRNLTCDDLLTAAAAVGTAVIAAVAAGPVADGADAASGELYVAFGMFPNVRMSARGDV